VLLTSTNLEENEENLQVAVRMHSVLVAPPPPSTSSTTTTTTTPSTTTTTTTA